MRAIVLDPGLHSPGGHHFSTFLRLTGELNERDVQYRYLVSTRADSQLKNHDSRVVPAFSRCVYGRTRWDWQEFLDAVAATGRELRSWRAKSWRQSDLIIVPCCDQVMALALAEYLLARRQNPGIRIVVWLMYGPHYKKSNDDPAAQHLLVEYRAAMSLLALAAGRDNLTVFCETSSMAAFYEQALGLKVEVEPGPSSMTSPRPAAPKRQDGVNIVCVGHANESKGYRLLPAALKSLLPRAAKVGFTVHGNMEDTDVAEGQARIFEELAALGPRVTVLGGVLSDGQYRELLDQADLMLLPYDPVVYRTRGSGVFNEATFLGIPVIAPAECGFAAEALADGRAVAIRRYDSAGIEEAVLRALQNLESLKQRAASAVAVLQGAAKLPRLLNALCAARASEDQPSRFHFWRRLRLSRGI
jgi:glycosyltransferase involved in cell wall biosynthesis